MGLWERNEIEEDTSGSLPFVVGRLICTNDRYVLLDQEYT